MLAVPLDEGRGTWLIFSWPPAATTLASPQQMAWYPSTTDRSPEPHTMLTVVAGTEYGMPAFTAACRAGFWPQPEKGITVKPL